MLAMAGMPNGCTEELRWPFLADCLPVLLSCPLTPLPGLPAWPF